MRSTSRILSIIVIILSAVSIPALWACWIDGGVPVSTASDAQQDLKMIADGERSLFLQACRARLQADPEDGAAEISTPVTIGLSGSYKQETEQTVI